MVKPNINHGDTIMKIGTYEIDDTLPEAYKGYAVYLASTLEVNKATKVIDEARKSRSGYLLSLAQTAWKTDKPLEAFLSLCEDCEAWGASKECPAHLRSPKAPKAWIQAKSRIKAGLEIGVNPCDFDTESSYRKAITEAKKAKEAEGEREGTEEDSSIRLGAMFPSNGDELIVAMGKLSQFLEGIEDKNLAIDCCEWLLEQAKGYVEDRPFDIDIDIEGDGDEALGSEVGDIVGELLTHDSSFKSFSSSIN